MGGERHPQRLSVLLMLLLLTPLSLFLAACSEPTDKPDDDDDTAEPGGDPLADDDDDGYFPAEGDCDDADANVYPGAVELCDGRQTDCTAAWTDDAGRASFVPAEGEAYDLTSTLGAGAPGAPVEYALTEAGTLNVCEGTFYARVDVQADATIAGIGDPEQVVLSGGGVARVISIDADVEVTVRDVVLTEGGAEVYAYGNEGYDIERASSGLLCGSGALTLDGVEFRAFEGDEAVIFTRECGITLTDITFADNTGRLLALLAEAPGITAQGLSFVGNSSEASFSLSADAGHSVTLSDLSTDADLSLSIHRPVSITDVSGPVDLDLRSLYGSVLVDGCSACSTINVIGAAEELEAADLTLRNVTAGALEVSENWSSDDYIQISAIVVENSAFSGVVDLEGPGPFTLTDVAVEGAAARLDITDWDYEVEINLERVTFADSVDNSLYLRGGVIRLTDVVYSSQGIISLGAGELLEVNGLEVSGVISEAPAMRIYVDNGDVVLHDLYFHDNDVPEALEMYEEDYWDDPNVGLTGSDWLFERTGRLVLRSDQEVTLESVIVRENDAGNSPILEWDTRGGPITLRDVVLEDNITEDELIFLYDHGRSDPDIELTDCSFIGNVSTGFQINGGVFTIDGLTFTDNVATETKGYEHIAFMAEDTSTLANSTFSGNTGGLPALRFNGSWTVTDVDFSDNDGGDVLYYGEIYTFGAGASFTCDEDTETCE